MVKKLLITLSILFSCVWMSCLREDDIKKPFETMTPTPLNDGWIIGDAEVKGFDKESLESVFEDFHKDKNLWQARSLIVAKDGCLIGETYTKSKGDMLKPQAVWSCTKQILAILVMKAIEDGFLPSLELTIGEAFPEIAQQSPDKAAISLRQLMTMTSGIKFENSGLYGDTNKLLRREPKNSLNYILNLPMKSQPGGAFNYSDGDPQIISAMLSAAIGETVYTWSRPIFETLSIENYDWLMYPDGLTMGAFGLKLTPRDLAKFGQIVLDGGRWNGSQIISEASVAEITNPAISASKVNYQNQEFGLLWWINPEDGTPYMHGQGGQYVMINRENRVVVCITAEPNTQGDSQLSLTSAFKIYRRVVNAVK